MKRIGLLAIILIILLGLAYWLWQGREEYKDSFAEVEHTQFAVENAREVLHKIFLADKQGNQALFEKQSDGSWTYTNQATGKVFRPSPNAFNNLMETVEKVRARNRVPAASVNSVLKGIGSIGIKVELYNKQDKKMRTYYIGGPADAGQATFAVMEGSEVPYMVYLPKFSGSIDTRYTCREEALRDKAMLRLNPKKIAWLEMEYYSPEQRPYSFHIDCNGGEDYKLRPLYQMPNGEDVAQGQLKKEYISAYLEEMEFMGAERLIYDAPLRDSIVKTVPFAQLRYEFENGKKEQLSIYPVINPSYDRGDGRPGLRERIIRYFVDRDEDHFYLAQNLVLQKLLRPYDFFLVTEAPQAPQQ